jgi:hypothetical protein
MSTRQHPPKSRRTITSTDFMPAAGRHPRLLVRYSLRPPYLRIELQTARSSPALPLGSRPVDRADGSDDHVVNACGTWVGRQNYPWDGMRTRAWAPGAAPRQCQRSPLRSGVRAVQHFTGSPLPTLTILVRTAGV